ncbi:hypothetical protein FOXG_18820 [Fusarium oxysporum f. sp. lycopersici 4287]|uniref:Uncharacterized protein n=1 Tax=Fusarium oxysporum f. sp. lycopersici (strain 4287 / CBS 123668 / FGSC 9935 / NRRL 34936) TaxID=426428 RepID=A0A0J9US18_FUSO4|nr:hypothetical protein FOXG_18820 [Fusarium oxysporum f. sp. lycopersici 4287]KNB01051.1 hypothetical protein FOXG_18820 [Fusarium oxysporum f. sp. lycopersici 4287]
MALDLQPQAIEVPHYSDGDGDDGQDVSSGGDAWLIKLKPTMPSATILSCPEARREYTETRLPMIPSPPTSSDNGPCKGNSTYSRDVGGVWRENWRKSPHSLAFLVRSPLELLDVNSELFRSRRMRLTE